MLASIQENTLKNPRFAGYLRRVGALEEVRRLTRDRNKTVREMARRILPDLEATIRHDEECGKSDQTWKNQPSSCDKVKIYRLDADADRYE